METQTSQENEQAVANGAGRMVEWEILETWSRRGGVVTQWCRRSDGEFCVLKTSRDPGSGGWLHLLNLVETLRSLAHRWWTPTRPADGFVGLRHVSHSDNRLQVELEYVPGKTMRKATMDTAAWGDLMGRLLTLVGEIHDQGRVHGDLKPDNLLLSEQGHLVLADFGYLQEAPERSTISLKYVSPRLDPGPASDLFAIGVLWQELCPEGPAWLWKRISDYPGVHEVLEDLALGRPSLARSGVVADRAPYVARPDWEALWERWLRGPSQGRATWTALGAPSGMGKSRFLREMAQRSQYRVLWGGCNPGETGYGFGGLHQALAQLRPNDLLKPLPPSTMQLLGRVFPSLRGLCQDQEEVGPVSGPGYASRIRELLTSLLRACSSPTQPLWLIIDDLQWADENSWQLLSELSRESQGCWIVTLAYRSDEYSLPAEMRLDFHGQLPPLDADQAQQLGARLECSPEWVERAQNWSGGSPFFLLELLRQGPQLDQEMQRPRHSRGWLERRLTALGPGCQRLLAVLACQGRRFELEPLEELGFATSEVEQELEKAEEQQLIWRNGPTGVFCHDQVRETVLALQPQEQLQEWHAGLARSGRRRQKSQDFCRERAARVAHHLQKSPQPRRSLPYWLRLAARAEADFHFAEAHHYWSQALQLHSDVDVELACHRVEKALDRYPEAEARLRRLLESHPERGYAFLGFLALSHMERGDFAQGARYYSEAFRRLLPGTVWQQLATVFAPRPAQRATSPSEQLLWSHTLSITPQLFFHSQSHTGLLALIYLLRCGVQWKWELRPAFSVLSSILYHLDLGYPGVLVRQAVKNWLRPEDRPEVVAQIIGPTTSTHFGSAVNPEVIIQAGWVCSVLRTAGDGWHASISTFAYSMFLMMQGELSQLAQFSREWLAQSKNSFGTAVGLHFLSLSQGQIPDIPEDLFDQDGDFLFLTHQAALAAQVALRNGRFDWALSFFRRLDRRVFSLDECTIAAWHATLARSAAECLPRRAGQRREQLLQEAESQLRRCLRRSKLYAFYHLQALREQGLVQLLRGQERDGRNALLYALEQARNYRMPYQELLTQRELVRCGRALDWPGVAWHEQECVRLCLRMQCPWLLPGRAQLWPNLPELCQQAAETLGGQRSQPPHTTALLAQSPLWRHFWEGLMEQARLQKQQQEQLKQALGALSYQRAQLEKLAVNPILALTGQNFELQVDSQRAAHLKSLQRQESKAISRRLEVIDLPLRSSLSQLQDSLETPEGLGPHEKLVLGRVVRELLTNARRHCPNPRLEWLAAGPEVSNPSGDFQPGVTGRGLEYIRFRLAEIGARLEMKFQDGVVRARVLLRERCR